MVALQTKDGLAFGYVLDMGDQDVSFEVNSNMHPGEEMSFRMELKGYEETVMGHLRVTQVFPSRTAAWPHYRAKILEIPEDDRRLLSIWLEDQRDGGSSRRVERDPGAFVKDMFAGRMHGASEASTKLVIERINARRSRRDALFKKGNDVFSQKMTLTTGTVLEQARATTGEREREAVRQALGVSEEAASSASQGDDLEMFDLEDLD